MKLRNKAAKSGSSPGSASSAMDEARKWAARLVADGIITRTQCKRLLSSHCSVLGSDGKSYGLSFDPSKQNAPALAQAAQDSATTNQ